MNKYLELFLFYSQSIVLIIIGGCQIIVLFAALISAGFLLAYFIKPEIIFGSDYDNLLSSLFTFYFTHHYEFKPYGRLINKTISLLYPKLTAGPITQSIFNVKVTLFLVIIISLFVCIFGIISFFKNNPWLIIFTGIFSIANAIYTIIIITDFPDKLYLIAYKILLMTKEAFNDTMCSICWKYYSPPKFQDPDAYSTDLIALAQNYIGCCGINSYEDLGSMNNSIPFVCCKRDNGTRAAISLAPECTKASVFKPCLKPFYDYISSNSLLIYSQAILIVLFSFTIIVGILSFIYGFFQLKVCNWFLCRKIRDRRVTNVHFVRPPSPKETTVKTELEQ